MLGGEGSPVLKHDKMSCFKGGWPTEVRVFCGRRSRFSSGPFLFQKIKG